MMKIPFSEPEYNALVAQLFVRFPSFASQGAAAYKPGLERMREICRRMGEPQNGFRTIHVAGTNGKGSTCNMLAAQFAAKGQKVGLYTSPHILDFRERMRVVSSDGARLVSREKIWELLHIYDADFRDLDLSFFEITTALAFKFFADEKVDIAVIETGLGGRLDATNVIMPILSVITNIGLDHTDLLGGTLPLIAREKAGIIKGGVPVVVGESHPQTDPVFREVAESLGSPITFADAPAVEGYTPFTTFALRAQPLPNKFGPLPLHLSGGREGVYRKSCGLSARTAGLQPVGGQSREGGVTLHCSDMDLKGCYQVKNVRTVTAAMQVLGLEPDIDALKHAARICDFHGRWEVISDNPRTICDIGHNEHGLKYNFAQLNSMLDSGEFSDLVMVYGSVSDKDVDAVLKIIPGRARVVFTAADNHRAMPAAELASRFRGRNGNIHVRDKVADAVQTALALCAGMKRPMLYIGGSTYVVSEALQALKSK